MYKCIFVCVSGLLYLCNRSNIQTFMGADFRLLEFHQDLRTEGVEIELAEYCFSPKDTDSLS